MLSTSLAESANGNGDDISIPDDSNTKKVRFKDSDMSPDDVMVVDPLPEPSLSWKDMLVGKETLDLNNTHEGQYSVDSFALTKQDVKKYCIDGVPSIDFSKRVYQLLEKEMSTSVVLRMLGRNLGIMTLQNRLYGIWKPSQPFQLMDIENGYYLAKFQNIVDYDKILSQGPWPLMSKIFINANPQRIEYENLPVVCFNCGCYGHTKESCSVVTQNSSVNEKGESSGHDSGPTVAVEKEAFGPWMLVERKSRRDNLEGSKKVEIIKEPQFDLKNKGKAPLIVSQFKTLTTRKFFLNGLKKDLSGMSVESSFKGQARVHQSTISLAHQATSQPSMGSDQQVSKVVVNLSPSTNKDQAASNICGGLQQEAQNLNIVAAGSSKATSSSRVSKGQNSKGSGSKGCASNKFLRAFREYDNQYKPDIVSLLEPRISGNKADKIIAKLGWDKSHRVESVGFSGGIWIGWKDSIDLKVVGNHPQFILTRICSISISKSIYVAFVYESLDKMKRKVLWNDLSRSIPIGDDPWMAIGDFNAILFSDNKKCGHIKGCRCHFFGDFMDKAQLHDLGFQSPFLTWHHGNLSERLGRAVGNDLWMELFPNCSVSHLPRIKSDRRPLLFNLFHEDRLVSNRPFRFLAGWLHHQNFFNFVKENWSFDGNMTSAITGFTDKLKNWNKCVYGHIFQRKRRTVQRKNLNKITALRDNDGDWIFYPEALKTEAVRFFQKLYGENSGSLGTLPPSAFASLNTEDADFLGGNAVFFQNQWDNIGDAICEWVKKIFEGGIIDLEFNNTLIVLIPKAQNLENFSQFQPISLCSALYKLVMKVIANRFKSIFPKIIGQEQAGFIAGRSIIDNIIIAQEVLHSMRSKKRLQWMAVKIDLEKAYDRVRWDFVEASLNAA
ncbi:reverse transcriptase [Gossypium australe]|uniref:Reverse transcriptase n=1 Tax=Gossypium australe TaxID=47621 RepID=A0A5B6X0X4_9ROSI|nr:reverse transcriptase [Gossypium australe]